MALLVVLPGLAASPAAARRSHYPDLFRDLFSPPVRHRGVVHAPKRAREPKQAQEPKQDSKQAQQPKEPHETKQANDGRVPMPAPRPAEAPKIEAPKTEAKAEPDKPAPPSACRLALTEEIAIAPSVPDIHGPGGCGGEDLVRLEAIVLPDKHRVSMKPAATMRCGMAAAIAEWVRSDVEPLAQAMGTDIADLENYDAYECRGRNGVVGALLSEHGRANALDVHAFKLANGQSISLTDRDVPRPTRESVLHSACTRFTTVLGPGSDGYHEDHIHLDLMERHNNYKICQWNVWDPMPQIAPLMPAERPAEAPPRQVAHRDGPDAEGAEIKPGTRSDTKPADSAEPEAGEKAKPDGAGRPDSQSMTPKSDKSKSSKSESSTSEPDKSDSSKSKSSKSDVSKSDSIKSDSIKSDSSRSQSDKPQPDAAATKKRRQNRRS